MRAVINCGCDLLFIIEFPSYREAEVKKFISGGKNFDALKAALADPPVHTKDENAKVI